MNRFDTHGPEFFLLCGIGGIGLIVLYLLLGRSPSGCGSCGGLWDDDGDGDGCGDSGGD